MERRGFLSLAGAAAIFPHVALAQRAVTGPRVALISSGAPVTEMTATGAPEWRTFIPELGRLGYVEGRTISFERYLATPTNSADVARIVVGSAPDAVYSGGGTASTTLAITALSKTLPVVLLTSDPVGQGVFTNLARPGGNVTAIATTASPESQAKNLELLAETIRTATRVAYFVAGVGGQPNLVVQVHVDAASAAAEKLGLAFSTVVVEDLPPNEAEYRRAFAAALATKPDIVQFGISAAISNGSEILAKLALDASIPAASPYGRFAEAGGLLSYGSNALDNYRKAAGYIALVLQGARPGELPVLLPTLFDLIVNLKTAKTIGVTVPESILVQATQVIQ